MTLYPASEGNSQFPLELGKPIQVIPTHSQPHPKSHGSTQGSTQHRGPDRALPVTTELQGLLIFLFALDFSIRSPRERINIYLGVKLFIQLLTPCKSSAESCAPCTSIQAVLLTPGDSTGRGTTQKCSSEGNGSSQELLSKSLVSNKRGIWVYWK